MKNILKWFIVIGLSLVLSACGGGSGDGGGGGGGENTYYADSDGDGYGDADIITQADSVPAGYVEDNTDCDDASSTVHPGAQEICDQVDNNCNNEIDEGGVCVQHTYYRDADGDGYGDPNDTVASTDPAAPAGYASDNTDCDDANSAVHPGAAEACDGIDNNCSGAIDEGCQGQTYTYYRDSDHDGYGDPVNSIQVTDPAPPAGYVSDNTDCADTSSTVHPGAQEVCDQVDNNCDNAIDEGGVCVQHTYYRDADGDGYGDPNDTEASTDPVAPDGYVENSNDCNDASAAINPAAQEVCDQVDNNCNNAIDEGVTTTYYADSDGDGYGNAGDTTETCSAPAGYIQDNTDCDDTDADINPGAEEIDDNIDNDCDGEVDEDITPVPLPPANVSASDIDTGLTYIAVTWDTSDGATYYKVYRAIWEEDADYELVADNITETSYHFVQDWQTDVYDLIGPNPAMAPNANVTDRAAFTEALETYRTLALPVLFDFKAPAYFRIEACNDLGCSAMSDFDAGQAEYIHTATESEIAQSVIPLWDYPLLTALADAPPGMDALSWCGIDICGPVEGILMGRLNLSGLYQIDFYYNNYVEGWDLHPNARFRVNGYIGGEQRLIPSPRGFIEVSGESDVSVGAVDAHLFAYCNENNGYISITYKGETYQYTLPIQPVDGQAYANPPVPVDPARDDADYTIDRRDTGDPVPFAEEPNTDCANWSDDMIVDCNIVP